MVNYAIPADPVGIVDELADVYGRVFAEPPYLEGPEQVQDFVLGYTRATTLPGFTVVAARDDQALVGFAYGTGRPAGSWWPRCDAPPPPAIVAAPTFAVYEWAVAQPYRRRGIGRELLARLLDRRSEQWASLSVDPAADAYRIYLRAGWRKVCTSYRDNGPPMAVLVLRLS